MACNIKVPVGWSFVWILIFSWILSKINRRLTCLSYVLACIYILDWLLVKTGLKVTFFELSYKQMITLVGILHVLEGILTFFWGAKKTEAIIAYRGKKTAGGYSTCGQWLIPLLFFSINGYYVPIVAGVVYFNETVVMRPEVKARWMGGLIGFFGLSVIGISKLVALGIVPLGLGILCMPLLHEGIFLIDTYIEKMPLKYPYIEDGLRVMELLGENDLEIERGDIIKQIDGEAIKSEEDYIRCTANEKVVKMELERMTGERVRVVCTISQLRKAKMVFLPPV